MGRHRPDPRGHARIFVAAFAVVLAVALLAVGAYALVGAMTSKPDAGATATTSASPSQDGQTTAPASNTSGTHLMVLKVTGPSAAVTIANTANTHVFYTGVLNHGETRFNDSTDLVVTVDPAQNVQVLIRGKNVAENKTGHQTFSP